MGIFERFGIMRSILTVECVGWFGTKEYLSVIFRNIRRSIRKINQLRARAHFSIHGDCHRSGLCRIGVSHTASNRNFTAQSGSSQAMTSSRWPSYQVTFRWPSGDHQVTFRWPSGDFQVTFRRWCWESVAAWSSGAGCATSMAGRPSPRCAPANVQVEKYCWQMQGFNWKQDLWTV